MSQKRVLVIEDDERNARLARAILELKGCTIAIARTGEEGVDLARCSRFDVVLMDLQLPGMDGFAATRQLKSEASTRDIPVIAVTALARPEDRAAARAAGCVGYVTKPYGLGDLIGAIEDVLQAPVA